MKSSTLIVAQEPKGRLTFRTSRLAIREFDELSPRFRVLNVNRQNGQALGCHSQSAVRAFR
jgi:hypothetical protein